MDEAVYDRQALEAWTVRSQTFCIEKSRDWQEVLSGVQRLRQNIPPDESSLRQAFETWLQKVILPRFGLSRKDASDELTLEELETMLAENIDRWNHQIREEGRLRAVRRGKPGGCFQVTATEEAGSSRGAAQGGVEATLWKKQGPPRRPPAGAESCLHQLSKNPLLL